MARVVVTDGKKRVLGPLKLEQYVEVIVRASALETVRLLEKIGCKPISIDVREDSLDVKFECEPSTQAILVSCEDSVCYTMKVDVALAASKG